MRFEVRIPAYERPELLLRALKSLQAQTYAEWTAIVFDDSRSNSVAKVVLEFGDQRIQYVRNSERKGAAANIDDCFDPVARFGGGYGCLLEDDNYWMPGFLEKVVGEISKSSAEVFLVNQRVHVQDAGLKDPSDTTRGLWFKNGWVTPIELRATLLLMEGLSNGGLVWKLGCKVDLRVGSSVKETALHEACRSLLITKPFQFIEEPLAVWTEMPLSQTARMTESNRVIGRGNQAICHAVICAHGDEVIYLSEIIALRRGIAPRLAQTLASCGSIRRAMSVGGLSMRRICKYAIKGFVLRRVQVNPCANFIERQLGRSNHAIMLGSSDN